MFIGVFFAQSVHAVTVYHYPTPYPLKNSDGSTMSQEIDKVHMWDGWLNNSYNQTLVRDDKLQVGGWGDVYRSYIKFDVEGLPENPALMAMYLPSFDRGDSSTTMPFAMCKNGSSWDLTLTWGTQPSFPVCWGWYSPPAYGAWWGVDMTSLYNEWKNGTTVNNGIMLTPQTNNNNFVTFRSLRHTAPYRPVLRFDFTPTINLKMPVPGNHEWLVTTEAGGWDCKGDYSAPHDGINYFAIDFSWRNNPDAGATIYTQTSDIPILAAAGGVVSSVDYNGTNPNAPNGYYVAVDHDYDNNLNTGVSTRYLHFKYPPSVSPGQTVNQGDVLGYMGNTGNSLGVHLHFGVRYQNNGSSTMSPLTKVVMDGRLLKGYQTECSVNGSGVPVDWIKYYRSYNTAY